jgi:hypothetical protein
VCSCNKISLHTYAPRQDVMITTLFQWEAFTLELKIKSWWIKNVHTQINWESECHLIKQGSKKHNWIFWSYFEILHWDADSGLNNSSLLSERMSHVIPKSPQFKVLYLDTFNVWIWQCLWTFRPSSVCRTCSNNTTVSWHISAGYFTSSLQFNPGWLNMKFMVDGVTLGHILLWVPQVLPC